MSQEIKYSGINTLSHFKNNIFKKLEEKLTAKIDVSHGAENTGKVLAIDETGNVSPQSMKLGQFENDLYGDQEELFLDLTLDDFTEENVDGNTIVYACVKQDWLTSVDDFKYEFEMMYSTGAAIAYGSENSPASTEGFEDMSEYPEGSFMCSFANNIGIIANNTMVEDALVIMIPVSKSELSSLSFKMKKLVIKKIPAKYLDVTMTGVDITDSEVDEKELNNMLEEVFG